MKLLINFCSRSRPTKFFNCLDNLRSLSTLKNYTVIAKIDDDDMSMQADWVNMLLKTYPECIVERGLSGSKVKAINRSLAHHVEDDHIILNHSDDFIYLEQGFDEIIISEFEKTFPHLDGAIHFNDSHTGSRTMTYSILGAALYKKLGYMYEPSFISIYCDNHLTELTRKMGKYSYVDRKIFNHCHPIFGECAWDSQYRHTESKEFYAADKATFLRLRENNYGL